MLATYAAFAGVAIASLAAAFTAWQATLLRAQVKHLNEVNAATFYHSVSKATTEFDRTFVTYPELRAFFYANKRSDDPMQQQQLLALAATLADAAEICVAAEDFMPHLRGDWDDYFGHVYRNSPALRQYWAELGHLYPADVERAFIGPSLRPKKWPVQAPQTTDLPSEFDDVPPQSA